MPDEVSPAVANTLREMFALPHDRSQLDFGRIRHAQKQLEAELAGGSWALIVAVANDLREHELRRLGGPNLTHAEYVRGHGLIEGMRRLLDIPQALAALYEQAEAEARERSDESEERHG